MREGNGAVKHLLLLGFLAKLKGGSGGRMPRQDVTHTYTIKGMRRYDASMFAPRYAAAAAICLILRTLTLAREITAR